jgi:hypothetical protein
MRRLATSEPMNMTITGCIWSARETSPVRWYCHHWHVQHPTSISYSVAFRSRQRAGTQTPLLASLEQDSTTGITGTRLWNVIRRFFHQVADVIAADHPTVAEKKLRRASTHWMRYTHATHALARGAELTTVRDNLRLDLLAKR